MFEPLRTSSSSGNTPKNCSLSGVLTLNSRSCSGEFEATDSSKYSCATPYCVRVDRQQFFILTLNIEQRSVRVSVRVRVARREHIMISIIQISHI